MPGVSRSGAVLTALRAARVERAEAARFSLLLSLPVTGGAAAWSLLRSRRELPALARPLAAGVPAAALTGAAAGHAWQRWGPPPALPAAVYRLGLAAVVAARLRRARPA